MVYTPPGGIVRKAYTRPEKQFSRAGTLHPKGRKHKYQGCTSQGVSVCSTADMSIMLQANEPVTQVVVVVEMQAQDGGRKER